MYKCCRYCHTKLALSTRGLQHHEAHCVANPACQVLPTAHAMTKRKRKRWICPVCAAEIDYWWRKRHPCWRQDACARGIPDGQAVRRDEMDHQAAGEPDAPA